MEKAELFQAELEDFMGDVPFKRPLLGLIPISLGFLMCRTVYMLTRHYSPVLFPSSYSRLSEKDKLEWNNRSFESLVFNQAISTVHSTIMTLVAAYLYLLTDLFDEDAGAVVFRSNILSQFFLGVSNGYFMTDLAMLLRHYPSLLWFVQVVHHCLSILSLFLGMHSGYTHIYLYTVYLSEITTPCVNLAAADKKKLKLYVLNGVVMFLSWLVFRVFLFIYLFNHMYTHNDQVQEIHKIGYCVMMASTATFAVMNLFWFEKITRGLVKTLNGREA